MFHYCAFRQDGCKLAELKTVYDVRAELCGELQHAALSKFNSYWLPKLGKWDGKSFQWGLIFMIHADHSFEPVFMVTRR